MNRLLLALLALFAGLAAQITPAQARIGGGEAAQVGLVESRRTAAPAPARREALVARSLRQERIESRTSPVSPRHLSAPTPAVRLGADRARE